MHIHVLASQVSDNFFVALADDHAVALIDPIDSKLALSWVEQSGLPLVAILNTHWHPDHVGGNADVLANHPKARVWASASEADIFENITDRAPDVLLQPGQSITVSEGIALDVIGVPGHTAGHIAFGHQHHLFSGDVLFRGGSGHCRFGGDPGVLFSTYRDVLRALPLETILYPGHDYSANNLQMAHHILPEDDDVARAYKEALEHTPRQFYPAILEEELRMNLFLRYDDPTVREALQRRFPETWEAQRALSQDEDEATWRSIRSLRDRWQGDGVFDS